MSDSWMPIEYAIARNKKLAKAGAEAAWLYFGGLLYAHQNATDGHLDDVILNSLVAGYTPRMLAKATAKLLEHALWEPDPDGFYIHDWNHYHAPAESVKARRQADRDRKRLARAHPVATVTRLPSA